MHSTSCLSVLIRKSTDSSGCHTEDASGWFKCPSVPGSDPVLASGKICLNPGSILLSWVVRGATSQCDLQQFVPFFNSSAAATQTASIQMESGKSGFLFQEEQWTSSESEKVKCSSWHGPNIKECKTSKAYRKERRHGREGNMRRVVMMMLYFHAQFWSFIDKLRALYH